MKQIEKILDLTPTVVEEKPLVVVEPDQEKPLADQDFEIAREHILSVLNKASEATQKIALVADEKEDARSYEVLNGMLGTITAASMSLLDIHQKKNKLGVEDPNKPVGVVNNTQNNVVFNGTPADLKKFLADMNKKEG